MLFSLPDWLVGWFRVCMFSRLTHWRCDWLPVSSNFCVSERLPPWLAATPASLRGLNGWRVGCLPDWLSACLPGCLPDWMSACLTDSSLSAFLPDWQAACLLDSLARRLSACLAHWQSGWHACSQHARWLPACLLVWLPYCMLVWLTGCRRVWLASCLFSWLAGLLSAYLPGSLPGLLFKMDTLIAGWLPNWLPGWVPPLSDWLPACLAGVMVACPGF
jgi:hypothetical protein